MIRASALYPNQPDATFDFAYFTEKHLALVKELLTPFGLVRVELDRGVPGAGDQPPPLIAAGHLVFNSLEDFQKAMAAHGREIMGDIPNYTNLRAQVQISEVIS